LAGFIRTNLTGASLDEARLEKARFVKCTLREASLKTCQAPWSFWHLSNLLAADFEGAVLNDADMIGADMTDANFRHASLTMAKLDRTNREGAKFDSSVQSKLSPENEAYAEFVIQNT
jgi:uncharacterized protein YjbI with pentapeptide repeats